MRLAYAFKVMPIFKRLSTSNSLPWKLELSYDMTDSQVQQSNLRRLILSYLGQAYSFLIKLSFFVTETAYEACIRQMQRKLYDKLRFLCY